LGAENTDIQERPKDLSRETTSAKNPPQNAAASDGSDWPPAFEDSQGPHAPVQGDEDSVNFDAWDGEEESLTGPNPFHLEQVEDRKSLPAAEGIEDEEPDAEFSVSGVWNAPDNAPTDEAVTLVPVGRLPLEQDPFPDPQFTWTGQSDQSTTNRNGSDRPPDETKRDPREKVSAGSLQIPCPHCGADVDYPTDELEKILRKERALSRPRGRAARLWYWCRRKPLTAALIAISVASLVLGIMFSASLVLGIVFSASLETVP
jgi:hypothetical protein